MLIPQDRQVRLALLLLVPAYLSAWCLVPVFVHDSPPLDVVEGWVLGQAWQAGYYKHPPLSPWLTAASTLLLGRSLWAVFILSPLVMLGGLAALWVLARQFLDERTSLVSVYLASTQLYFNLLIPEFNHNVMQTPLWAMAFALTWLAVRGGGVWLWAALGVVLGACALAKYSAALLYLVLGGFALLRQPVRQTLSAAKLAACALAATAVMAANLLWQMRNGWPALHYLGDRLGHADTFAGHLLNALSFVGAQVLAVLPILVVAAWALRRGSQPADKHNSFGIDQSGLGQIYLWASALAPLAICTVAIVLTGNSFKSMWGTMMFTTLALAFVAWRPAAFSRLFSRRAWLAWLALQVVLALVYAVMMRWGPVLQHKVSKAIYPAAELSAQLDAAWRQKTGGAPLRTVVGDTWTGGVVAFYLPSAPAVMIDADPSKSPWVSREHLHRCGALLVWPADRPAPPWVAEIAPGQPVASVQASVRGHTELVASMQWTLLPPQANCAIR